MVKHDRMRDIRHSKHHEKSVKKSHNHKNRHCNNHKDSHCRHILKGLRCIDSNIEIALPIISLCDQELAHELLETMILLMHHIVTHASCKKNHSAVKELLSDIEKIYKKLIETREVGYNFGEIYERLVTIRCKVRHIITELEKSKC
jgi:hypothetical protein